ncbi:glycosyl hydrolase [Cordyceps javanica]|uniref:Glycosyl hydrolase n=1 Tax=Cordyceps javanica TaxID=43265 RepID=A0A545V4V8_9HYPO|nr:glycosyl hydrolase [Cordyceps javanica]TQW08013.1 glycosyl hydrolase [Cordyceps javanica]
MIRTALASLLGGSGFWAAATAATAKPLTSGAGQRAAIPGWDLQSTASVDADLAKISRVGGADTSSWHHVEASRCTLMGCLLASGEYKDSELWFSNNLERFDGAQFAVPWVYRSEFALPVAAAAGTNSSSSARHFLLETNGISSRADIYLNGKQVADAAFQAGAYAGHTYDITELAAETNALLVRVHPTDYTYDLAVGFVDWNPYPPDNGTGVWRDITVKQTGAVAMGPLSVVVDAPAPVGERAATVKVRTRATNLAKESVTVAAGAALSDPDGAPVVGAAAQNQSLTLAAGESRYVEFTHIVARPRVWWPKAWGAQPLYTARVELAVVSGGGGGRPVVSDAAATTFGIRTVTSEVNEHNDTLFHVNGHPFQVLGAGYSADMFLRWDGARFARTARYMLDMGQNTIRLEGKLEQPELYAIADRLGLMVLAGWECCDKWEAWPYNEDLKVNPTWDEGDYAAAAASVAHEAAVLQTHPSMLGFLVGSDFWPDDRATDIYADGLRDAGWQVPIVASASKRGFPARLGPSGMKMDGPYDWVPPNYWFDTNHDGTDRYGAAFGFGSELGAGVGTPELGSLRRFLSAADMEDLWQRPDKGLFHMSRRSQFYTRTIYNRGLFARFGPPSSLDDYLIKAQLTDYEATRAQYEGYSALWGGDGATPAPRRPATGLVYWMLNNAWPSLHWNQFDYYMRPAGSYFGSKTGARLEHVAYDPVGRGVWLINHSLDRRGARAVTADLVDMRGRTLSRQTLAASTEPNASRRIGTVRGLDAIEDVAFLRLTLSDNTTNTSSSSSSSSSSSGRGKTLSRNVYWLARGGGVDELDWANSTWYHTPVTRYADYTALGAMEAAQVRVTVGSPSTCGGVRTEGGGVVRRRRVTLENTSGVPAFFVSLNLVDGAGADVTPVLWSDNYVTLWPNETLRLTVGQWDDDRAGAVEMKGFNVKAARVAL